MGVIDYELRDLFRVIANQVALDAAIESRQESIIDELQDKADEPMFFEAIGEEINLIDEPLLNFWVAIKANSDATKQQKALIDAIDEALEKTALRAAEKELGV